MTAIIKLKIATWKQYSGMVHSMNSEMTPGYKLSAVLLTSWLISESPYPRL